jgi:signal-transduction protein with cAMP-binding, CBS, and nucleotidyltransferase domain
MKRLGNIIRVRDVMKSEVDIVDGMMTVTEALKSMKYPDTRTLIVDKRHDDDEYGVVMFRDMAKKVLARDHSPNRVNIYEIMSKPVISIHPTMDIRYCVNLFDRFGLSRAPVIADGQIQGLISYTDIVLKGMSRISESEND